MPKNESKLSYHTCYLILQGFWYDENEREFSVSEWSSDCLHPGPWVGLHGFAHYYHTMRHLIVNLTPFLAQTKFMSRIDNGFY